MKKEIYSQYYSEKEIAGFLGITVASLRNRHAKGKNHPPKTPERWYPKKEFHTWNTKRLSHERAS